MARIYDVTARGIVRSDTPDETGHIRLMVPDNHTANDIDRALEKMRRDLKKLDTKHG